MTDNIINNSDKIDFKNTEHADDDFWDYQYKNKDKISLLHKYAQELNIKKVEELYNEGLDIKSINIETFYNALHCLAEKVYSYDSSLDVFMMVQYLIDKGLDINIGSHYDTPLFVAIKNDNVLMVDVLLRHSAEMNFIDPDGFSPLIFAIENYNSKIAELIVRHGADVNLGIDYETPLYAAIAEQNIEIFQLLIDKGAIITKDCYERSGGDDLDINSEYNDYERCEINRIINEIYKK